jgi:hypothetical protein
MIGEHATEDWIRQHSRPLVRRYPRAVGLDLKGK